MRERFARQSVGEDERPPISPGGGRPPVKSFAPVTPPMPVSPPRMPSPPPIAVSSKPSARAYGSLDDVVAAGAGAGVGLGVGALAATAVRHEEEPEEPEEHEEQHEVYEPVSVSPPPPPAAPQETWDTARHEEDEEDDEDVAARQRSQMYAEQEHEPEPEHHEEEQHISHTETGAQSTKNAIVLFEYEAQEENEINLIEGQLITNIEFIDEVPSLPFSKANFRDGGQGKIHLDIVAYSHPITLNFKNIPHLKSPPSPSLPRTTSHPTKKPMNPTPKQTTTKEKLRLRNTITKHRRRMR